MAVSILDLVKVGSGQDCWESNRKEVITAVMTRDDKRLTYGSSGGMRRVRGWESGC